MKKKWMVILPFVIMPAWIPVYRILDSLILVDIFGCGCVPSVQTNMLSIPFNANDLRILVFFALTVILSVWSIFLAKPMQRKAAKLLYCAAVIVFNLLLTMWVVQTFMWA